MKKKLLFSLLLSLIVFTWGRSYGAPFTLTSNNCTANVDPAVQSGVSCWVVDGTEHLFQQWFWYRVGSTGGESSIDTLNLTSAVQPLPNQLVLAYTDPQGRFTMSITYVLTGGLPGSKTSDILEVIGINNSGSTSLDFHFFQYSDFNLFGTPGNDIASRVNANKISQQDALGGTLSETVAIPDPSHWQIGYYASILNSLNDGNPTVLSDGTNGLAPGDITWAWQWDRVLGGGGSLIISKDKQLVANVPEPSIIPLLIISIMSLVGLRRWWKE